MDLSGYKKIILYVVMFLVLGFLGYIISNSNDVEKLKVVGVEYKTGETVEVNVSGCVKYHGTYDVEIGTKVHDVIYKAGGITSNGDPSSVDLDSVITEPCTIYISRKARYDKEVRSAKSDGNTDDSIHLELKKIHELLGNNR